MVAAVSKIEVVKQNAAGGTDYIDTVVKPWFWLRRLNRQPRRAFRQVAPDSAFRSSNWFPSALAHAVPGHRLGLELPADDRAALITFLRTL